MAKSAFAKALPLVLRYEGGYVNDPDDAGGETYRGVARNFHPHWDGWSIIDSYKNHDNFPKVLDKDATLKKLIRQFYRNEFWVRARCDRLPGRLGVVVFDTAVNMGIKRAGQFLQQAVNTVKGQDILVVDGAIGPKTLAAVKGLSEAEKGQVVEKYLLLREGYYRHLAQAQPKNQKFLKGWLNRVAHLRQEVANIALA